MGVVVAPLVWFAVAVGQGATKEGVPHGLLVSGLVLVGVGLVAGLLASLRTSPVGAIFAGIVFVGASAFMYLDHGRGMDLFTTNWKIGDYPLDLATPLTSGILAFAGGLLLMSVFSAARWRGRNAASDPDSWSPIPAEPADTWSYR
ncbi:MAG TPA: hypothetical protein VF062_01900 [Candidatus Limnocylindrales bacterium]